MKTTTQEPAIIRVHFATALTSGRHPCWRRIDTGERIGLSREDYQADDWEIMP